MYEIVLTGEAKKSLTKLHKEDQKRIVSALERCRVRPHHHVTKLVASPYFRLRIGKYRAIVDIDNGRLIIIVLEVGHRKNIYKR
ncbi:MAG: type II toxin-antitoxin system RelE family toxin [Nanobdellota archaeon]